MPRRQRRHPSKQVRIRLDATPETSSRTSTPRVDSKTPLSPVSAAPTPAPLPPRAAWAYYSRNSSLERKRRLFELQGKYGGVRAELISESTPLIEMDPSTNDDDEGEEEIRQECTCGNGEGNKDFDTQSTGLISLLSLPPTHPFAGTTTMEQRQIYWDGLPTYSGASIRTPADHSSSAFNNEPINSSVAHDRAEIEMKGKGKGKAKASILETLCCRAQTYTPVEMTQPPICVGAVGIGRDKYKVKTGLVRMSLDSNSDVGEGSSSGTIKFPQHTRVEASSSSTRHSDNVDEESAPTTGAAQDEGDDLSLEERLRNTTLKDLPLSPSDAAHVRALVFEIVSDRDGMCGTWPPRSKGRGRMHNRGDTYGGRASE